MNDPQTISSATIVPSRRFRLALERDRLRTAAEFVYAELLDRYDGAPDSPTKWMSESIERLAKVLGK